MKNSNTITKRNKAAIILLYIISIIAVMWITLGIDKLDTISESESLKNIEQTIKEAVITCYSMDGIYPDTYETLRNKTNIAVNEDKYKVIYEIFASNIMPNIEVIELS